MQKLIISTEHEGKNVIILSYKTTLNFHKNWKEEYFSSFHQFDVFLFPINHQFNALVLCFRPKIMTNTVALSSALSTQLIFPVFIICYCLHLTNQWLKTPTGKISGVTHKSCLIVSLILIYFWYLVK